MASLYRKFRLSMFAVAMTLLALMSADPVKADVVWSVNGTFQDGGTVSGTFTINVYGYLESWDITTTTVASFAGFEYLPGNSYISNGALYVDFEPGYVRDLHLSFLSDLGNPSSNNPILGGDPGPSWECVGSYSCYVPSGGTIRYVDEGTASSPINAVAAVPEPSIWIMLILGFLGIGLVSYRRRSAALAVRLV